MLTDLEIKSLLGLCFCVAGHLAVVLKYSLHSVFKNGIHWVIAHPVGRHSYWALIVAEILNMRAN